MNIVKNNINEYELFVKYKASYKSAFYDLSLHLCCLCSNYYCLWFFKDHWLCIFPLVISGFMIGRTFIIYHHCGHDNYTPSKTINYIIGILFGILVFNPFSWRISHSIHHLTSGHIGNSYDFFFNETVFHTRKQYKSFSYLSRQLYKLVRHPLVFFTIMIQFVFIFVMRFNGVLLLANKHCDNKILYLVEQIINNIGILIVLQYVDSIDLLYHYLAGIVWGYTLLGVTFHLEHTYNPCYVESSESWNKKDSGIYGGSFIEFPIYIKYFWGGGEAYHHIHHMNAKIPFYNLEKYHNEVVLKSDMFDKVVKLSMADCYHCLWLVLYDEHKHKYITFAEADN